MVAAVLATTTVVASTHVCSWLLADPSVSIPPATSLGDANYVAQAKLQPGPGSRGGSNIALGPESLQL